MKLLILFCGGTLVMEEDEKGVLSVPSREKAVKNLLEIEPRLHELADIHVEYIDNIDSSNIDPSHWDRIAAEIADRYKNYDGFIVTHGTDTMAYTAAALSFILQNIGKPVVLTGSQIPGNRIETDARRNLINAACTASMNIAGVMIVFDEQIILGTRASKVSESKLEAFHSVSWDLLGEIRTDIRLHENRTVRHPGEPEIFPGFDPNITVATLVPGMPVSNLLKMLESGAKGIILQAYGSGNIDFDSLDLLREAERRDIPVVVNTQCMEGATKMQLYDAGNKALQYGAIQAFDMGIETCAVKLMWALKRAQTCAEVRKIMHTNYCNEINKTGKLY